MKSLYTRGAAVLLCATTLAACGGSSGSLALSGAISGLNRDGLILSNNGKQLKIDGAPTSFVFPDYVEPDAQFEVKVDKSPDGQQCTATSNKNKANYITVTQTVIVCTTDPYNLGGTISGLSGTGLILANGAQQATIQPGATSFVFPTQVPNQAPYGVTVLAQPAGQTCSVSNGNGTMPRANKLDVVVTCQ